MALSTEIGKVISYMPVIRCIVSIVADTLRILRTAISDVEEQATQIQEIHDWLKVNDVNTFEEVYDRVKNDKMKSIKEKK